MNKSPNRQLEYTDVVWDADNTIWDWVTYAVHAYEAMSQRISELTGIPEPRVAGAMKRFYTDVGTMENEFLIQGLYSMGFFKGVKNLDMETLIEDVQATFYEVRDTHLKIYPHMDAILAKLHQMGVKNHILTDAPAFQASMRLRHFGLGEVVTSVNAMPAADPKSLPKKFKAKMRRGEYKVPFTVRRVDKEKPHTNLEKVLKKTRKQIRQRVRIVGDNLSKDGQLSLRYKTKFDLAGYGFANEELLRRLLRFAPAKTAKKNVAIAENPDINNLPPNMNLANSTSELADSLGIQL